MTEAEKRYEFVLKPLAAYLRRTQSENLVKDKVSSALNAGKAPTARLETAVVDKLLTGGDTASGAVASTANGALPAISDFLPLDDADLADWSSGVDVFAKNPKKFLDDPAKFIQDAGLGPAPFVRLQNQLPTLFVLYRTALILSRLRVALDELPWILEDGVRVGWKGWLDPNELPPRGAVTYESWRRLQDVIALRDALPDGALATVIAKADDKQAVQADMFAVLHNVLNWGIDDLKSVTAQRVLNLQFPADFLDERTLQLLTRAFEVLGQLRVSAKPALDWVGSDVTAQNARDICSAVKSNFDDATWLKIAKTVQDPLREKRRAALVGFLIGNRKVIAGHEISTPGDLFDAFLVDVEMSACQTTTRLVQAIFSVQLFIQRCLMNLEKFPDNGATVTVHMDPDGVRWWQGMQNFRLWQAGRQVFAHPENWVDPRLLDNKSPFFAELQNQLLQDDLTWDSAEEAIHTYLEKVKEVARLEVVGHYHEVPADNESPDVIHVVGRTWALPHVYYYRARVSLGGSAYWTPWEKIDADIDFGRVLPIIWHRRLYLFWPIFTEKAEDQQIDTSQPIPLPRKYWEIRLAWTEYKRGKWSPKKTSIGVLEARDPNYIPKLEETFFYFFKAQFPDDQHEQLVVECLPFISLWPFKVSGPLRIGKFVFNGCDADPAIVPFADALVKYEAVNEFEHDAFDGSLRLGTLDYTKTLNPGLELVLTGMPQYQLRYPHQYDEFYSQDAFFYLDDRQDMFVEPSEYVWSAMWGKAEDVSPGWLQNMDRIKTVAFEGMVSTQ